jgi:hypothetical protein
MVRDRHLTTGERKQCTDHDNLLTLTFDHDGLSVGSTAWNNTPLTPTEPLASRAKA